MLNVCWQLPVLKGECCSTGPGPLSAINVSGSYWPGISFIGIFCFGCVLSVYLSVFTFYFPLLYFLLPKEWAGVVPPSVAVISLLSLLPSCPCACVFTYRIIMITNVLFHRTSYLLENPLFLSACIIKVIQNDRFISKKMKLCLSENVIEKKEERRMKTKKPPWWLLQLMTRAGITALSCPIAVHSLCSCN